MNTVERGVRLMEILLNCMLLLVVAGVAAAADAAAADTNSRCF